MKLFFILACLLSALPRLAASPAVVIVLLPPATLQGWQTADAPTLHRLMQTGALGVLNTRTAHQAGRQEQESTQSALLTLAAGARAAGFPSTHFLPASSPAPGTHVSAAALFERRTGIQAGPSQSVCPDWPSGLAANKSLGYDLHLGNLADTLAAHGVTLMSGGGSNADWLAADGDGRVRHVPLLRAAPGCCLVWDAGPDIGSGDKVLARATAQTAALQGCLIVLSPTAGSAPQRQLAPVLAWGPGVPAGLLRSPSTRRPGLVTDTDLAPSVAALFGIPRTEFQTLPFGFSWSSQPASNAAGMCQQINAEAVRQSKGMRLLPYAAAGLGFWIACVTLWSARLAVPGAAVLVPLAALAAAVFADSATEAGMLFAAVFAVLLVSSRFVGLLPAITFICVFLTFTLCVDAVTGNTLMHRGLLGYSVLEGARYYGLGNEAMGLLLGSALVAADGIRQPNTPARFARIGAMVAIVILLGTAGAKAGGVLVSLLIFGTLLLADGGRRWTAKRVILLATIALTGMAAAALSDALLGTRTHSHIGEAIQRIAAGGLGEAGDIVGRKLAVEGRLSYHSAWALLLWPGILCTAWLWKKAPTAGSSKKKAFRSAGAVGVMACLFLNDAGVVAAAIFSVLLWTATMAQRSPSVLEGSRTEGPIS